MKIVFINIIIVVVLALTAFALGKRDKTEAYIPLPEEYYLETKLPYRFLAINAEIQATNQSVIQEEDDPNVTAVEVPPIARKRLWQFWQASESKKNDIKREMIKTKHNQN